MKEIIKRLCNLLSIKSIVTVSLTIGMLFLLSGKWQPAQEIIALYSTSFGAVITYFFTKKDE